MNNYSAKEAIRIMYASSRYLAWWSKNPDRALELISPLHDATIEGISPEAARKLPQQF